MELEDTASKKTLAENGGSGAASMCYYCSFAVTGAKTFLQDVYICHTCCPLPDVEQHDENSLPPQQQQRQQQQQQQQQQQFLGLCASCAQICHGNHDVQFLGTGQAYCDCHALLSGTALSSHPGCPLLESSRKFANTLWRETKNYTIPEYNEVDPALESGDSKVVDSFVREAYVIPQLQETNDRDQPENALAVLLRKQALELVRHSKDTFWLDAALAKQDSTVGELSTLERLASWIACRHFQHYFRGRDISWMGLEWWVQVKHLHLPSRSGDDDDDCADDDDHHLHNAGLESEAVDLHYDKDEDLAEYFGLGIFPTLSTVTYLTGGSDMAISQPPTIVFPLCYHDGILNQEEEEGRGMSNMWISHPRPGKHVVFDGRLLHGAPAHHVLRQRQQQRQPTVQSSNVSSTNHEPNEIEASTVRITFLVNLWKSHRPAGIHSLPVSIRKCLLDLEKDQLAPLTLSWEEHPYKDLHIGSTDDLPFDLRQRISLPFVESTSYNKASIHDESTTDSGQQQVHETNNGEEDGVDDDDGQSGMVVLTFPPPPNTADTVLVLFGPRMEAFLTHDDEGDPEDAVDSE